jgi:hypothetical protein
MTNTNEVDTWLTIQPSSFYHDACVRKQYCTAEQYLVINWNKWIKWYQDSMAHGTSFISVPVPAFVGDTYEIALSVAAELNKSTITEGVSK